MKTSTRKNQKGFTLIEIIAVLVILGILAAVAIPKYLDMREDSIRQAANGAISELNARERLSLAQSKLKDASANDYYTVNSYDLGEEWDATEIYDLTSRTANSDATMTIASFKGKKVVLKKAKATNMNEPAQWSLQSVE